MKGKVQLLRSPNYSDKNEYETPQALFNDLNSKYKYTLDIAASKKNTKCKKFYTKKDNAFALPWTGRCWCNPPYANWQEWIRYSVKQVNHNPKCELVTLLIPARTGTKAFQEIIWNFYLHQPKRCDFNFLPGRLTFERNGKPVKTWSKKEKQYKITPAPFDCMVVTFKK